MPQSKRKREQWMSKADKPMRELLELSEDQGYRINQTAQGHARVLAPDGQRLCHVPLRKGNARGYENARQQLRRIGVEISHGGGEMNAKEKEVTQASAESVAEVCGIDGCKQKYKDQERLVLHRKVGHMSGTIRTQVLTVMGTDPDREWSPDIISAVLPHCYLGSIQATMSKLKTAGVLTKPGERRYAWAAAHKPSAPEPEPEPEPTNGQTDRVPTLSDVSRPPFPEPQEEQEEPEEAEVQHLEPEPEKQTTQEEDALLEVVAWAPRLRVLRDEHGEFWIARPLEEATMK